MPVSGHKHRRAPRRNPDVIWCLDFRASYLQIVPMRHLLSLILIAAAVNSFADGPADNIPEKVRPVPPPGVKISDAARSELQKGAERLRREIDSLRGELKGSKSNL